MSTEQQYGNSPRVCTCCILPETFPGIRFDAAGLCNYCRKDKNSSGRAVDEKIRYQKMFYELLENQRAKERKNKRPTAFDALVAYSGGKDSTYTLLLLKQKYRLRVLAVTLDNGFLPERARRNIEVVCERLDIDHLYFKPKWTVMRRIFAAAAERELYAKKALQRASTICTVCMGMVKSVCLKLAIEAHIPLIAYGWSPGQAALSWALMKTNAAFIRSAQQAILKPLREIAGNDIEAYFLNEEHYGDPEAFPYHVHPLAWEPYHETAIREEIMLSGWKAPRHTDSNSSNCTLNAFANDLHIKKYGFHPYAWEIANMVRSGVLNREEGRRKILADQPADTVARVKKRLFMPV